MIKQLRLFLEMIRFSHTIFALPFALLSAALAWHTKEQGFSWVELFGILLCMVFARSAAMAAGRRKASRMRAPLSSIFAWCTGRPSPAPRVDFESTTGIGQRVRDT